MTPLYIIILGNLEPYAVERDLADMGRARTVAQIAEGQFENLRHVLELDVAAGTSRNVTDELVAEAEAIAARARESNPIDLRSLPFDHRRDRLKHEVVL